MVRESIARLSRNTILLLLIAASYLPLAYAFLFSFNHSSKKGTLSATSFYPSATGYRDLTGSDLIEPLLNSLLISTIVSLIVSTLSLLTCFALWRRRNLVARGYVNLTSQVIMINPDIITAFSLALFFLTTLGGLGVTQGGFFRLVAGYSVISLPYAIFTMLPRSYKFPPSLFEASIDLGFNRLRSWYSTYLRHMMPAILSTTLICFIFTLDDFIVARILSNLTTLGTLLYQQQQIKTWILAIGVFMLLGIVAANLLLVRRECRRAGRGLQRGERLAYYLLLATLILLIVAFISLFILGYTYDLAGGMGEEDL